jgi:hypothetical protein
MVNKLLIEYLLLVLYEFLPNTTLSEIFLGEKKSQQTVAHFPDLSKYQTQGLRTQ